MGYFPFYIDIQDKSCLVVGGGNIALRKIEKLMPFHPDITVIAPCISEEISKLSNIRIIQRDFHDDDIENAFMVISATDNRNLNSHIFKLCHERNILVNTVDDRENCEFIFPSIVKNDSVTIGISTSGKCPIFARFLREKLESTFDRDFATAKKLSEYRSFIKCRISSENIRKRTLEKILRLFIRSEYEADDKRIYEIIEEGIYEDQNRHARKSACFGSDQDGD